MNRPRALFLVLSALLSSCLGYLVSRTVSESRGPIRFAFSESRSSPTALPKTPNFFDVEDFPSASCQWPDGRTSITVKAARQFDCFPMGVGKFPIPAANSFALLDSAIGGARFPVQNGNLSDDLRFVHLSPNNDVIDVSPVLLQFGDYSGGARPSFVESDGSLWIFDYRTEHGAEVIRISTATGTILQRTSMPSISRPVVAVNRLGFWLGQDSESFFGESPATPGIWLAPVGASRGVLVKQTNGDLFAMQPSGTSMAVYLAPDWESGGGTIELWRFTPVASSD